MKNVLHVGCGPTTIVGKVPPFTTRNWSETRLDIEPATRPDIVASMTDMNMVADASQDAVFSSHNLEHLFPHELRQALAEFLRVLKPGGFLLLVVPDLQLAVEAIAAGKADVPLYESPGGPITPLDVLYGHRRSIEKGKVYMAHRNGFVRSSLQAALDAAGFAEVQVKPKHFDLIAMAYKGHRPPDGPRLAQAPGAEQPAS